MKFLRKYHFMALPVLILAAVTALAASSGVEQTLDRAAAAFRAAKSITADYEVKGGNDGSLRGRIIIAGERFALSSPVLSTWYDGTTQWSYNPSTSEVNVSEPTAEELSQINPFAIISAFRSTYTVKQLSSKGGRTLLRLTARSAKADIRSVDLTLDSASLMPTSLVLSLASGQKLTITVSNLKKGAAQPISTFRFNKAAFPHVDIIDLR